MPITVSFQIHQQWLQMSKIEILLYNMTILSNFDFMEKIDLFGKILSLFSKPTGFLTLAPS